MKNTVLKGLKVLFLAPVVVCALFAAAWQTNAPASPEGKLAAAQSEFDAYRYEEAIPLLRSVAQEQPSPGIEAQAHWLLGKCYERMGILDTALHENTLALALLRRQPTLDSTAFVLGLLTRASVFESLFKQDSAMLCIAKADSLARWQSAAIRAEIKAIHGDLYLQQFYMVNILSAYSYYTEALAIAETAFGKSHPITGCYQARTGACMVFLGNIADGNKLLDLGVKNIANASAPQLPYMVTPHVLAGVVHCEMARAANGLEYHQKVFDMVATMFRERHPRYAVALGNIGIAYFKMGEGWNALPYFHAALRLSAKYGHPLLAAAGTLDNLGQCYLELGQMDSAQVYCKRGLEMREQIGKPLPLANSYLNLSRICGYMEDCPASINAAQAAIKIFDEQKIVPSSEEYESALNNIAACRLKSSDPDTVGMARPVFEQTLRSWRKRFQKGDIHLVKCLQNIGDSYFTEGQIAKAFTYYDSAMAEVKFTGLEDSLSELPPQLQWAVETVGHIIGQEISLARKTGDVGLCRRAFARCQNSFVLIERVRRDDITVEGVRQNEQTIGRAILEVMCDAARFIQEKTGSDAAIKEAFGAAERMKGYRIFRNLSDEEAIEDIFSAEIGRRNRALQDSVSIASIDLAIALQYKNKASVAVARDKQNRAMIGYRAFKDSLLRVSPAFREKFGLLKPVTVEGLQQHLLEEQQAIVEFVLGMKTSHVFVVTRKGIILRPIHVRANQLGAWVEGLVRNVKSDTMDNSALKKSSYMLYESLLKPLPLPERLVIIPDGVLAEVPFAALLRQMPGPKQTNWATYDYLIEHHAVSYGLSATLLHRDKQSNPVAGNGILAMAPFSEGGSKVNVKVDLGDASRGKDYGPLPGSRHELEGIKPFFSPRDDFWFGSSAGLDLFRQRAEQYRYLHISTHGEVDMFSGQDAFLLFSEAYTKPIGLGRVGIKDRPGLLTVREVYGMRLSAEMSVLPACYSGAGFVEEGEGSISFCRAFTFAGSRSVMAALWRLNDVSGSEIIVDYYQELLETAGGRKPSSKDRALQQAQLDYLNSRDKMLCHPYYWASLTVFGNFGPIKKAP